MQHSKTVAVIIAAFMLTGCLGYLLQTEHHPVETITYSYSGDSTPSVQASQIDDWTQYNPLQNVTGWSYRAGIPKSVDSQGNPVANQYILSSATYSYTSTVIGAGSSNIIPQNATTVDYDTYTGKELNEIWVSSNGSYGITAMGAGSNFPYTGAPMILNPPNVVKIADKSVTTDVVVYGGYSQSTSRSYVSPDLIDPQSWTSYHLLNITVQNIGMSTATSAVYIMPFSTWDWGNLSKNTVITTNEGIDLYVVTGTSFTQQHSSVTQQGRTYSGTVADNYLIYTVTAKGFIYNSDNDRWYTATKNAVGVWEQTGDTPYRLSEIGMGFGGTAQTGTVVKLTPQTTDAAYADPTKFVEIPLNVSSYWSNNEVDGVISFICSPTVEFRFDNGGRISFPSSIPYDFVYVTLDFVNQSFTYRGVTSISTVDSVPSPNNFVLADYDYSMVTTGTIPSYVGRLNSTASESILVVSVGKSAQASVEISGNVQSETLTINGEDHIFVSAGTQTEWEGYLAVNTTANTVPIHVTVPTGVIVPYDTDFNLDPLQASHNGEIVDMVYVGEETYGGEVYDVYTMTFSDVSGRILAAKQYNSEIWYEIFDLTEEFTQAIGSKTTGYIAYNDFVRTTTLERYSDSQWTVSYTKSYLSLENVTYSEITVENNLLGTAHTYLADTGGDFSGHESAIITVGGTARIFVDNTVVQVDPLGLLWGNPSMYLGYYFQAQMTEHNTRLLFNGFVKFGSTITINGETFDIIGTNIIIPVREYDEESQVWTIKEYREYPIKGMAVDFIGNTVSIVFTESNNDTYPVGGWTENNPGLLNRSTVVVPNVEPQATTIAGYIVSASGTWYWQSGLYTINQSTEEQYGLLLDGSFGLGLSGACFLMIGILILGIAVMNYGLRWELDLVDWLILVMTIILLAAIGISFH